MSGKAKQIKLDTSNFDGALSSADDTVQKAMETLDDASGGGTPPSGEIRGLVPSHAAETAHDISISPGSTSDLSGVVQVLAAALVKQIDATWAVGTNAGGMFAGTVTLNSWYHLFLIKRSDTDVVDAGFDLVLDPTANLPANYDSYKRIGSVLTDGSANIIGFTAEETAGGGLDCLWDDPPQDADGSNSSTAANVTLSVPTGYKVKAKMNLRVQHGSSDRVLYVSSPDVNDEAASSTTSPMGTISCFQRDSNADQVNGNAEARTNTSGQVRWRSSGGGGNRRISLLGWEDARRG